MHSDGFFEATAGPAQKKLYIAFLQTGDSPDFGDGKAAFIIEEKDFAFFRP